MNETYEWLYDTYALPLIQVTERAESIKQSILTLSSPENHFELRDQIDALCTLWGTDSFSLGLQLGLRLMAGQRPGALEL